MSDVPLIFDPPPPRRMIVIDDDKLRRMTPNQKRLMWEIADRNLSKSFFDLGGGIYFSVIRRGHGEWPDAEFCAA